MAENDSRRQSGVPKSSASDDKNTVGFIDDYANDSIQGATRNRSGHVVFSNPLEKEKKPKKRVTKRSRKRYRMKNAWLFVTVFFFAAVVAASAAVMIKNNRAPSDMGDAEVTLGAKDTSGEFSDNALGAGSDTAGGKKSETVSNEDVHTGNLILVNYKYPYVFPEDNDLVSMFDTEKVYSVNTTETYLKKEALDSFKALTEELYENSGCDGILVSSAFRTMEKQREIYDDRVERYGSEYAASYVAVPGYSEHHTGLSLDISILADDGYTYDIEDYADAAWFMKNYSNYGYILRYPVHKAAITSIDYEGWHYRYVGLPHSLIIKEKDFCLEEYIDYLRNFTFDKKLLVFSEITKTFSEVPYDEYKISNGDSIIYYVPSSNGSETEIPTFDGVEYEISGNNVDGFIVTARAG